MSIVTLTDDQILAIEESRSIEIQSLRKDIIALDESLDKIQVQNII